MTLSQGQTNECIQGSRLKTVTIMLYNEKSLQLNLKVLFVSFFKVILFSEKRIYGFTIQDWYSQYRTHTHDRKTESRGNC